MSTYRGGLVWLGSDPSDVAKQACDERGLSLVDISVGPIPSATLAKSRGIIMPWPPKNGQGKSQLGFREILRDALWHGVPVVALCELGNVPALAEVLKQSGMLQAIEIVSKDGHAVELIARSNQTPRWSGSSEVIGDGRLNDEEKILLRRAFGDCTKVHLIEETSGSTKVYRAHARLGDSMAGPLALPFFVKFNGLEKTKKELQIYNQCTTLHIPFNQRPNLDLARCALGHERGVIVGNYVEQSESLQEVIARGAGGVALRSLFDSALGGWRRQVYFDDSRYIRTSKISDDMALCYPSNYKINRQTILRANAALARDLYGATLTVDALEGCLKSLPAVKHRVTLTHGDLHGENVRVAGQTAILIDFMSVSLGPLVADPASLDVSLMINAKSLEGPAWDRAANLLYSLEALTTLPASLSPEDAASPLIDAIRYIRQVGLSDQMSDFEYATAVALQLLRKASYNYDEQEPARRRIIAYALAERLTLSIFDRARDQRAS